MTSAVQLADLVLASAERFPQRPAVETADGVITYAQLVESALAISASLEDAPLGDPPLVAVLARRSPAAFAGILGALLRGAAYMPIDPSRASARNRSILERTGCRAIVADAEGAANVSELLGAAGAPSRVLVPDLRTGEARALISSGDDEILGSDDLTKPTGSLAATVDADAMAYLLFTSGSTGVPKGVMVSQANALHLVERSAERYGVTEADRFSHNFALTFDLSVFDMFVAWSRGACLCCPTEKELLRPDRYLARESLSIWFSVPSVAVMMHRLKLLRPDAFPGLRLSLFCGEALPARLADAWAQAAPNGPLDNLYGPTEATVFCTGYRWDGSRSRAQCERDVVPIGRALAGVETRVVDASLSPVRAGEIGELLVGGPQVALGYWQAPELTERAFVALDGQAGRYYRTGDLVRASDDGPMQFLGRGDDQIKLRGHRVELGEIEAALRKASGVEQVVVLPMRVTEVGAEHVAGLVEAEEVDGRALREALASLLPSYMIPREFLAVDTFPKNDNGKVDRGALGSILEMRLKGGRRRT
ncbi:MAG: D-alanine--poly(phosphoribitol) ligase [bacterium]|nr:D-alanine--poly(phosphoribitol) ligase [bacterium]